ncbi:MAG TPA: hypothetical protein EYN73_04780 [Chromatiaceae bacterium]|nr:hypothetical protein [Chromatiaceae bacterium]HIN82751.1 hypothetical protein [Chromatiales bacterium]
MQYFFNKSLQKEHSLSHRPHPGPAFLGLLLSVLASLWAPNTWAATDDITPKDVYVEVAMATHHLRYILEQLNPVQLPKARIHVDNAEPREMLFQAQTLYRLSDQLAFDITYTRQLAPKTKRIDVVAADVLEMIELSRTRIELVSETLGITPPPLDAEITQPDRTLSDAFNLMVEANSILNQIVHHPDQPRDVFSQVTLAIGYASKLLSQYPGTHRIPEADTPNLTISPPDMQIRLTQCFERIRLIAQNSNTQVLDLDASDLDISSNFTASVFHLSSLIVSELSYLHASNDRLQPAVPAFDPGPKTAAEVYQRTGILMNQLDQLVQLTTGIPKLARGVR